MSNQVSGVQLGHWYNQISIISHIYIKFSLQCQCKILFCY